MTHTIHNYEPLTGANEREESRLPQGQGPVLGYLALSEHVAMTSYGCLQ